MKAYDLVMARELLLNSAPEYAHRFFIELSDADRQTLFYGEDGQRFLRSMTERESPIVQVFLARYLGSKGVLHEQASIVWKSATLSESVMVALMSSPRNWTNDWTWAHSPENWDKVSDLAKLALGENVEIHFEALTRMIDGNARPMPDDKTLAIILLGLSTNPAFKQHCFDNGGPQFSPERFWETEIREKMKFEEFLKAICTDLRKPIAEDRTHRGLAYETLFLQLPKIKISPEETVACLKAIANHWTRSSLEEAFAMVCASNLTRGDVVSLLSGDLTSAARSGMYRGIREVTDADVDAWLATDGLMAAKALAKNNAIFFGGDYWHRKHAVERLLKSVKSAGYDDLHYALSVFRTNSQNASYAEQAAEQELSDSKAAVAKKEWPSTVLNHLNQLQIGMANMAAQTRSSAGMQTFIAVACLAIGAVLGAATF